MERLPALQVHPGSAWLVSRQGYAMPRPALVPAVSVSHTVQRHNTAIQNAHLEIWALECTFGVLCVCQVSKVRQPQRQQHGKGRVSRRKFLDLTSASSGQIINPFLSSTSGMLCVLEVCTARQPLRQ